MILVKTYLSKNDLHLSSKDGTMKKIKGDLHNFMQVAFLSRDT